MDLVTILLAAYRRARRQHSRQRAAFWAALIGLSSGILLMLSPLIVRHGCACTPRLDAARQDARSLSFAVQQFRAMLHRCPLGTADLRAHGLLARDQRDPWGHAFVITCHDDRDEVRVCSRGRDGLTPICDDDPPLHRSRQ